jgi:tRNA (guanine9-N1)-methyltransferase
VCSFGGKLKERFDGVLGRMYESWKGVRWFGEGFVEVSEKAKEWMAEEKVGGKLAGSFGKYCDDEAEVDDELKETLKKQGEVVYLSSEASEDLTELKPYSTYIIGGLVDKNREKGICFKRAREAGVRTARLPIGSFMEMQSRKVLATNHVNEIMLKWLECGDWGEAFMKAIPKRKGGKLKNGGKGSGKEGRKDGEEGDAGDGGEDEDGEANENDGGDDDGDEHEGDGGVEVPAIEESQSEQQATTEADQPAETAGNEDAEAAGNAVIDESSSTKHENA